ncbi:hypothetical protein B0H14DRAFT_2291631, partial [Mycena olivaceomarginata]
DAMNDVLSFHNEKLAGETYNFIHLRTRPLSSSGAHGSGVNGHGCAMTHRFLCDEIRQTTYRIDGFLRLQDCERKLLGQPGMDDIDEVDLRMARRWRGWRDGYISWHLDCRRYRLVFLK